MKNKHLSYFFKSKSNAFTLTEFLIGLVICAIIILVIGAISNIGYSSFENLRKESQVYSDILYYGFDLIKNSVRKAHNLAIENLSNPTGGQWMSQAIVVDGSAFVLFKPNNSPTIDFVYLRDKDDYYTKDIIFDKADNMSLNSNLDGKLLTVIIQGNKGKESFNLTTSVMRRN